MPRKAKKYEQDTEKIMDLIARSQQADHIRPELQEWHKALGIPEKTFYNKLKKREVKA